MVYGAELDARAGRNVHCGPAKFFDELVDDLIAHAEFEFELNRPQESGGTLRDEYLSIQRQKGGGWIHPGLIGPPCPPGLEYLLGWFSELSAARSNSGFGSNPIGYTEMKAWAELTGRTPSPMETIALRRIDASFLKTFNKRDG